ncbi:MAG: hypothetical protein PHE06_14345 [Lachnospiraceae bacterium]|nr:hypothetical protein [Lachnospiraceae bacterium]
MRVTDEVIENGCFQILNMDVIVEENHGVKVWNRKEKRNRLPLM